MKLRPVETVIDGVTIAGTCQGPKNISESVNSALSAATKSFSIISKGTLATEPIIAEINHDLCTWRGKCAKACPFDAISKETMNGKEVAVVNASVCKGCGMCAPVLSCQRHQFDWFYGRRNYKYDISFIKLRLWK